MKRIKTKSNPFGIKCDDIVVPSGLRKTTNGFKYGLGNAIEEAKVTRDYHSFGEASIKVTKGKQKGAVITFVKQIGLKPKGVGESEDYEIY